MIAKFAIVLLFIHFSINLSGAKKSETSNKCKGVNCEDGLRSNDADNKVRKQEDTTTKKSAGKTGVDAPNKTKKTDILYGMPQIIRKKNDTSIAIVADFGLSDLEDPESETPPSLGQWFVQIDTSTNWLPISQSNVKSNARIVVKKIFFKPSKTEIGVASLKFATKRKAANKGVTFVQFLMTPVKTPVVTMRYNTTSLNGHAASGFRKKLKLRTLFEFNFEKIKGLERALNMARRDVEAILKRSKTESVATNNAQELKTYLATLSTQNYGILMQVKSSEADLKIEFSKSNTIWSTMLEKTEYSLLPDYHIRFSSTKAVKNVSLNFDVQSWLGEDSKNGILGDHQGFQFTVSVNKTSGNSKTENKQDPSKVIDATEIQPPTLKFINTLSTLQPSTRKNKNFGGMKGKKGQRKDRKITLMMTSKNDANVITSTASINRFVSMGMTERVTPRKRLGMVSKSTGNRSKWATKSITNNSASTNDGVTNMETNSTGSAIRPNASDPGVRPTESMNVHATGATTTFADAVHETSTWNPVKTTTVTDVPSSQSTNGREPSGRSTIWNKTTSSIIESYSSQQPSTRNNIAGVSTETVPVNQVVTSDTNDSIAKSEEFESIIDRSALTTASVMKSTRNRGSHLNNTGSTASLEATKMSTSSTMTDSKPPETSSGVQTFVGDYETVPVTTDYPGTSTDTTRGTTSESVEFTSTESTVTAKVTEIQRTNIQPFQASHTLTETSTVTSPNLTKTPESTKITTQTTDVSSNITNSTTTKIIIDTSVDKQVETTSTFIHSSIEQHIDNLTSISIDPYAEVTNVLGSTESTIDVYGIETTETPSVHWNTSEYLIPTSNETINKTTEPTMANSTLQTIVGGETENKNVQLTFASTIAIDTVITFETSLDSTSQTAFQPDNFSSAESSVKNKLSSEKTSAASSALPSPSSSQSLSPTMKQTTNSPRMNSFDINLRLRYNDKSMDIKVMELAESIFKLKVDTALGIAMVGLDTNERIGSFLYSVNPGSTKSWEPFSTKKFPGFNRQQKFVQKINSGGNWNGHSQIGWRNASHIKSEKLKLLFLADVSRLRFTSEKLFDQATAKRRASFVFFGWNPPTMEMWKQLSGQQKLIDFGSCQNCFEQYGLTERVMIVTIEKEGCDNLVGSTTEVDKCGKCGGFNECLDCSGVQNGKSTIQCNRCLNPKLSSPKDCNDICNGQSRMVYGFCINSKLTSPPQFCDGRSKGGAMVNKCGYCVRGNTGHVLDHGVDRCGVCGGSDQCLGCDGLPNSGKRVDLCGNCLPKQDPNVNRDCLTLRIKSPKYLHLSGKVELRVTASPLVFEASGFKCFLISTENSKNKLSARLIEKNNGTVSGELLFELTENRVVGDYSLECLLTMELENVTKITDSNSITSLNFTQFQLTDITPSEVVATDKRVKVSITGQFPTNYVRSPYCITGNGQQFAGKLVGQRVECRLSNLWQPSDVEIYVVFDLVMSSLIKTHQKPITLLVKGQPPIIAKAYFLPSLDKINIAFSVNINPSNCKDVFSPKTLKTFGDGATCSASSNLLTVKLGQNSNLQLADKIQFIDGGISQSASSGPYLKSIDVAVESPVGSTIPEIRLVGPSEITNCSQNFTLSVVSLGYGARYPELDWTVLITTSEFSDEVMSDVNKKTYSDALRVLLAQQSNVNELVIPIKSLLPNAMYIVSASACNFLSQCGFSNELQVNVRSETVGAIVEIQGIPLLVRPDQKLRLLAQMTIAHCDQYNSEVLEDSNTTFEWNIQIKHHLDKQTKSLKLSNKAINIWPRTFRQNDFVSIRVQAIIQLPSKLNPVVADGVVSFTVEGEPLVVNIGSTVVVHGNDQPLLLDGSRSHDPNANSEPLKHIWTCKRLANETGLNKFDLVRLTQEDDDALLATPCFITEANEIKLLESVGQGSTSAVFSVPSEHLPPATYLFTDTVSTSTQTSRSTTLVKVVSGGLPVLKVSLLSSPNPDSSKPIVFGATIEQFYGAIYVTWKFEQMNGYGRVVLPEAIKNLTNFSIVLGNQAHSFRFTLPASPSSRFSSWSGLSPNTNYLVKVTASIANGTSEAFLQFRTNSPPSVGGVQIKGNKIALRPQRIKATGFWVDDPNHYPLSYTFGIEVLDNSNKSVTFWCRSSLSAQKTLFIPSGSYETQRCGRIGYKVIVKVCDLYQCCSEKKSELFEISTPQNLRVSMQAVLKEIEFDVATGDYLSAYEKLIMLMAENCWSFPTYVRPVSKSVEPSSVAGGLLNDVNINRDFNDAVESLTEVNNLLLMSSSVYVSNETVSKITSVAEQLMSKMGLGVTGQTRKRRAISAGNANTVEAVDAKYATQLLGAYEVIAYHNKDDISIRDYINMVNSLLAGMCRSLDPTSDPMTAKSSGQLAPLATIKSNVVAMTIDVTNSKWDLACQDCSSPNLASSFVVSNKMQSKYQMYTCNYGNSVCNSVCLTSAQFDHQNIIAKYLLTGQSTFNHIVSDLFLVSMVDPSSGQKMALGSEIFDGFVVYLLLRRLSTSYKCKMRLQSTGEWDSSVCEYESAIRPEITGVWHVRCRCTKLGYVAVFENIPNENVVSIAPNKPMSVKFFVEKSKSELLNLATDSELVDIFRKDLTKYLGIPPDRISSLSIDSSVPEALVTLTFEPPTTSSDLTQSELIPKFNLALKILSPRLSFNVSGSLIYPSSSSVDIPVISPTLSPDVLEGDNIARRVQFRLDANYASLVSSSDDKLLLEAKLSRQLARAMHISYNRIVSVIVAEGMYVSFVIQSRTELSSQITAEDAAFQLRRLILQEKLSLEDVQKNNLKIDKNSVQIEKADNEVKQTSKLPGIVGGVVGTIFFLVIALVVALVIIKNKGRIMKLSPQTSPPGSASLSSGSASTKNTVVRRMSLPEIE